MTSPHTLIALINSRGSRPSAPAVSSDVLSRAADEGRVRYRKVNLVPAIVRPVARGF